MPIAITNPAGGETWLVGSIKAIKWWASSYTGQVLIEVSRNGGAFETVISTTNDGQYDWLVSGPVGSAVFRISSISNPSDFDIADGAITISASLVDSDLVVTSPVGGESIEINTTHTITWESGTSTSNVSIYLNRNGTAEEVVASTPNTGQYDWDVNGPAGTGVITITDIDDSTITDSSNSTFNILPPTTLTISSLVVNSPIVESQTANLQVQFEDTGRSGPIPTTEYTLNVSWGDGTSSTATVTPAGAETSFVSNFSHIYNDNGSYTISVTITDSNGGSAADTESIIVSNSTPTILTAYAVTNGNTGACILTLNFADLAGTYDDYIVTVSWGDTTSTSTSFSAPGLKTISHTYAVAPKDTAVRYSIRVTVVDSDGASTFLTFNTRINWSGNAAEEAIAELNGVVAIAYNDEVSDDATCSLAMSGMLDTSYSATAQSNATCSLVPIVKLDHSSIFLVVTDLGCKNIGNKSFRSIIPSDSE